MQLLAFYLGLLLNGAIAFRVAPYNAPVSTHRLAATRTKQLVMTLPQKEKPAPPPAEIENNAEPEKPAEPEDRTKKMLQQVKDAGVAGAISYAFWELGFWGVSIPVCVFGYYEVAGHWPDFTSQEDLAKLGTEAFAFVNVARLAVPLRIGLALSTTPWVQANVVDKFNKKSDNE
uniref:DUF1279 domain-containing protein n=1 Tax=Chrysotila carterae TaxID=13221 RepID=A0A7S4C6V1_CHRCT|mmetsp:Transcript_16155/g.34688  ORF Transcript_16155/g.34688 Transcript_16155/m.34688 type:complete len:174 (+) Transcript_16155:97-618(+)